MHVKYVNKRKSDPRTWHFCWRLNFFLRSSMSKKSDQMCSTKIWRKTLTLGKIMENLWKLWNIMKIMENLWKLWNIMKIMENLWKLWKTCENYGTLWNLCGEKYETYVENYTSLGCEKKCWSTSLPIFSIHGQGVQCIYTFIYTPVN